MTVAIWRRWGAPRRLRRLVDTTIAAAIALATATGIDGARYSYEWERAIVRYARTEQFAKNVPARALSSKKGPGQVRRGHLMRALARLYRAFVFDPSWPIFWASIEGIAEALGVEVRQARAIVAQAELAGALTVIRRWYGTDHERGEPRTNVYILSLPSEAWQLYAAERDLRALGLDDDDDDASPSSTPAKTDPTPSSSAPTTTDAPPPRSPAAAPTRDLSWFPAVFHAIRNEDPRYKDDGRGGHMKLPNVAQVESLFEDDAARCRADCEKLGLKELPSVSSVARELAARVVRAWLEHDGSDGFLLEKHHAIGFIRDDVATMLPAARKEWLRAYAREQRSKHPPAFAPPRTETAAPDVVAAVKAVPAGTLVPWHLRRRLPRALHQADHATILQWISTVESEAAHARAGDDGRDGDGVEGERSSAELATGQPDDDGLGAESSAAASLDVTPEPNARAP